MTREDEIQRQYRLFLQRLCEILTIQYMPLMSHQIGFVQTPSTLMEKKAFPLSKLITLEIQFIDEEVGNYCKTQSYKANRMYQEAVRMIDETLDGFQSYFVTVQLPLLVSNESI